MKIATIAPVNNDGKSRRFHATCLGIAEANPLWDSGSGNNTRPVWAMFAGSEQELRPFMANLITGKRASLKDGNNFEFLRSVGFRVTWQKELEGSIATIFLPELFELDPGMVNPDGANFIVMPSLAWSQSQKIDMDPILKHMEGFEIPECVDIASLIPVSFLFASYLDRRTRFPLYADGRFYTQLLLACMQSGIAVWPDTYRNPFHNRDFRFKAEYDVPIVQPIAFHASHETIGEILDKQVTIFIEATGNKPALSSHLAWASGQRA